MSNIENISARQILDSRGEWTVEVRVELSSGAVGAASAPQGKSSGSAEAAYIDPSLAVGNIRGEISKEIKGKDFSGLQEFDGFLKELDGSEKKERLGANALLPLSVAVAKALAAEQEIPLWSFLRDQLGKQYFASQNPRLFANLINGGLHSGSGLAFQEYLVIPKEDNIDNAISQITAVYNELGAKLEEDLGSTAINIGDEGGFCPALEDEARPFEILGEVFEDLEVAGDFNLGMDAAAENIEADNKEMLELYNLLVDKFNISYIEDPFGENDFKDFSELLKQVKGKCVIAGDDLTTTNVERMEKAKEEQSVNGVIIKPNQIGTLSETLKAIRMARDNDWTMVVSHRSGETNDNFIADLAYGVGADGFKLGAPARGERVAKYNRLLEISI